MLNHQFTIKDGVPTVTFGKKVQAYMSSLKDGDYVMSIESQKTYKTKEQRGYFYGVLYGKIMKEEGWTQDEFEDFFLNQFGARMTIKDRQTGHDKIVVKGVSKHTVKEMSALIEGTVNFLRYDQGMVVPEPEN